MVYCKERLSDYVCTQPCSTSTHTFDQVSLLVDQKLQFSLQLQTGSSLANNDKQCSGWFTSTIKEAQRRGGQEGGGGQARVW